MGLMGLLMACYGGLWGILSGLIKSTDHPSILGIVIMVLGRYLIVGYLDP